MLQEIVDKIVYGIIRLSPETRFGQSINYFIYDSIKIIFLLFLMISAIGFLRTYIPQDKIKKWLSGKRKILAHASSSFFGAITPFCSCSSIPIFISFLKAGVPLGVGFSFLITSPLINEYLVIMMFAFFGWKITLAYVLSGILIGIVSGMILSKMKLEKYLVKDFDEKGSKKDVDEKFSTIKQRIDFGISEAMSIVRKMWLWILIGVSVGAIIHNYIPEDIIQGIIGKGGIFTVPVAVLIGVPMYGSCAAILPIAVALFNKGIPLGTALAFMMAVSALSFPEAIILRRAMRLKLILIFFGIVALGIVFTGYVFNFLQAVL